MDKRRGDSIGSRGVRRGRLHPAGKNQRNPRRERTQDAHTELATARLRWTEWTHSQMTPVTSPVPEGQERDAVHEEVHQPACNGRRRRRRMSPQALFLLHSLNDDQPHSQRLEANGFPAPAWGGEGARSVSGDGASTYVRASWVTNDPKLRPTNTCHVPSTLSFSAEDNLSATSHWFFTSPAASIGGGAERRAVAVAVG